MSFHVELLKRESYDTLLSFHLILTNSEEVFPTLHKNRNYRFLVIYTEKKVQWTWLHYQSEFLKQPYISNWTRKHQNNEYCQSKNSWLMANKHYTKISFLISQLWNIIPASKLLAIWVVHRSRCVCPFLLKLKPTNISYKEDNCW